MIDQTIQSRIHNSVSQKTSGSKGGAQNSKAATSMAELMAKMGNAVKPLQKGEMVTGTVKKLTPQEILLDIGAKGDALVLEYDKKNVENLMSLLHVGDTVNATVISPESEQGFPVVSLRRTLDDLIYAKFEKSFANNAVFSVKVSESTRGGYFVQNDFGIQAFLPNSQTVSDADLSGKTIEVKVIEFDRSKKRVIVSQKAVSFVTDPAEIEKFIKKGSTVEGVVASVIPYGLYVTLVPQEGVQIEGFVHVSEIAHERVENISERFKKGDTVTAQVSGFDTENRRVNLSLKALEKDTFEEVKEKYKIEQKIKGTITDVKTRGISLTLEDGTHAFIPGAKVPADTTYTVGQTIEGEITDFDTRRRVLVVAPVLKKAFVGYR